MSNAATLLTYDRDSHALERSGHEQHEVADAFRGRILAAMRDLRARERRASAPDLRLGDAANDDASLVQA